MEEPVDFHIANQQKDWQNTIQSEINSVMRNRTWDVVDRLKEKMPIIAKWIFRTKRNMHGGINKLKAKLVVRSFQQQEGVDYHDIFAPIVRWSTIRIVLALAAHFN